MISGFVALEMYKVHSVVPKKLEDFRSGLINLAFNMFDVSEPCKCPELTCKTNNEKYTLWTTWEIDGDITVAEFIEQAKKLYNANVDLIAVKSYIVYMSIPNQKNEARLNTKITDILLNKYKYQLTDEPIYIPITASCVDENDDDIETPQFCLKVK